MARSNRSRTVKTKQPSSKSNGKAHERLWVGFSAPNLLRQPALRTFRAVLSQNEVALGQATGFTNISFGYSYALFNGGADYLAVFDSYRILEVQATFRPTITTGISGFSAPSVYTVIDYDDSNPLTTASAFREYSNVTITQYETVQRTFAPAANFATYDTGGAATGYGTMYSPWCDAASPNVEHHGMKLGMDGGVSTSAQAIVVNHRFLVEFRCTR